MKAKASKRTRRTRPIRNSQLASKRNAAAAAAKKASLPIVTTGPKPQQPQVAEKIMVSGLPTFVLARVDKALLRSPHADFVRGLADDCTQYHTETPFLTIL